MPKGPGRFALQSAKLVRNATNPQTFNKSHSLAVAIKNNNELKSKLYKYPPLLGFGRFVPNLHCPGGRPSVSCGECLGQSVALEPKGYRSHKLIPQNEFTKKVSNCRSRFETFRKHTPPWFEYRRSSKVSENQQNQDLKIFHDSVFQMLPQCINQKTHFSHEFFK